MQLKVNFRPPCAERPGERALNKSHVGSLKTTHIATRNSTYTTYRLHIEGPVAEDLDETEAPEHEVELEFLEPIGKRPPEAIKVLLLS